MNTRSNANHSRVLAGIRKYYNDLRDSERRVADFVLEHPEELIRMSIREVAEQVQTSDATVIRFCQSIGFKGYPELKISLALDFSSPLYNFPSGISERDDIMSVASKVTQNSIKSLDSTYQHIKEESLNAAIEMICNADRVFFYGMGGSGLVAQTAHYQFLKIGIPCFAYVDPFLAAISASQLGKADVAVGISYSGLTKDLIKTISTAKDAGAKTIAVTSDIDSPLARICDLTFEAVSRELPVFGVAVAARSAQYAVIDILYVGTALRRKDEALSAIKKGSLAVTDKSILV
ncbi:MAG: MurR/RpiR family transcriptional regulator [Bacillota bacterium]